MKQIKIRDKEYNCSNRVYYHIQGLESENRVISMELLGHENNELQQQKEIERLNNTLNKAIEYIENIQTPTYMILEDICDLLDILKGVDKE